MSDRQHDRRGFIKILGAMAALTFTPGLAKATESFFSETEKIVTEDATYYPTYESHDLHPDMSSVIRDVSSKHHPIIYFRECLVNPGFLNMSNQVILTAPYKTWNDSSKEYGTLVTSDEISALYETDSSLSIEGFVYDRKKVVEDYKKTHDDFNHFVKDVAVSTGVNVFNTLTGREVSSKAIIDNIAALLALGWSSGNSLEKIASDLDKLPSDPKTDKVKNALYNTSAFLSHLHPENMSVFFRNLLATRKMQTLAKNMKEYYKGSNPGLIFDYGHSHRGTNDLLTLESKKTLIGFSIYSDEILREVIDSNGGITEFCKTLVIPIKSVNLNENGEKQFVHDTELRDYLENRLGKETDNT